jgi:hypothetical protein
MTVRESDGGDMTTEQSYETKTKKIVQQRKTMHVEERKKGRICWA